MKTRFLAYLALALGGLAIVFSNVAHIAQAAPTHKEVSFTTTHGKVTFLNCTGTCTARDVVPSTVGPVRPWQTPGIRANRGQLLFKLTDKGIVTSLVDDKGNAIAYTGLAQIICFAYTSAEATAAGGVSNLRVAHWLPGIDNCNDDWRADCTPVKGSWYVLKTEYINGMACAGLRLTGNFALVQVTNR